MTWGSSVVRSFNSCQWFDSVDGGAGGTGGTGGTGGAGSILFACLFIWLVVAESYIVKADLDLLILLLPLLKTLQACAMVSSLCSTGVKPRVPCMLIKLSIN